MEFKLNQLPKSSKNQQLKQHERDLVDKEKYLISSSDSDDFEIPQQANKTYEKKFKLTDFYNV